MHAELTPTLPGGVALAVARDLTTLLQSAMASRWDATRGPLDSICRYALVPHGKLLRPLLLLQSVVAVGGEIEPVLPAAVGAECGHVASLVHDDIIDGDEMRRGQRSVHSRFGIDDAIVAGDALIFDIFRGLAECADRGVPGDRVVRALDTVARGGIDLCRGQMLEAEITASRCFDIDRYLTMVDLKTGAFFGSACECGAILGMGTRAQATGLSRYGRRIGQAFQIMDDLLPYVSSSKVTGKPTTSDLRNCRITLPVLLAWRDGSRAARDAITDCFDAAQRGDGVESAVLGEVLHRSGAIDSSRRIAGRLVADAKSALAPLDSRASRVELEMVADTVTRRLR